MIIKLQQGGTSGGGMPPFADYTPLVLPYQDPFSAQYITPPFQSLFSQAEFQFF